MEHARRAVFAGIPRRRIKVASPGMSFHIFQTLHLPRFIRIYQQLPAISSKYAHMSQFIWNRSLLHNQKGLSFSSPSHLISCLACLFINSSSFFLLLLLPRSHSQSHGQGEPSSGILCPHLHLHPALVGVAKLEGVTRGRAAFWLSGKGKGEK